MGTLTSSEVPWSRARSSSDHIVGTGISRGRNFRYSVHGVGARSLGLEVSRLERTRCAKRYIIISARVDFDEEQLAVVSARSQTAYGYCCIREQMSSSLVTYLMPCRVQKLTKVLVDLGILFDGSG